MSRPAFKTSSVFHSPPDHLLNCDGKSAFMLSSYLVTPCVSSFLCVGSVTLLVSLVYSAIPLLLNTSLAASSLLSLLNASPWHSGYSIRLFLPAFLLAASPWNAGKDREGLISWFFMLSDTHSTSEFIALRFSSKHSSPTLWRKGYLNSLCLTIILLSLCCSGLHSSDTRSLPRFNH